MGHYHGRRVLQALLTIYLVITISFVMIRMLPGGPVDYVVANVMQGGGDPAQARELANAMFNINVDAPIHVQYFQYMESVLLHGDLGQSYWYGRPVVDIVAEALPWTLFVMTIATVLSFLVGIALGGAMALLEGSRFDIGATFSALLTNSVPYYVVAVLLLLVFAYNNSFFPTSGRFGQGVEPGVNLAFVTSVFYHAALPVLSLVLGRVGGIMINMRANSISVIGEDYLRVARLRGLPTSRISLRYVTYNSVLPMYTGLLISIGSMFGGSVILEEIFRYPGVGYYFFKAINARDYPLMMGAFILTTTMVVLGILVADLTYGLIDPRIDAEGEA